MVCDGMPGMMMESQTPRKKNLNDFLMPLGLALAQKYVVSWACHLCQSPTCLVLLVYTYREE